jgi:hypothetical protein
MLSVCGAAVALLGYGNLKRPAHKQFFNSSMREVALVAHDQGTAQKQ